MTYLRQELINLLQELAKDSNPKSDKDLEQLHFLIELYFQEQKPDLFEDIQ